MASMAVVISAAVFPSEARMAACITCRPMPVDRFAELMTVTLSEASSSSAASRITLPEVDMLSEMEKQMISRPSSTKGCMTSMASVREGAEVLGVVLFSSDHRKISSGVISTPSRYSSSPSRMCRGRMVMSYFSTNSFDRSQVLSEMILTVCAIESTFLFISNYSPLAICLAT